MQHILVPNVGLKVKAEISELYGKDHQLQSLLMEHQIVYQRTKSHDQSSWPSGCPVGQKHYGSMADDPV